MFLKLYLNFAGQSGEWNFLRAKTLISLFLTIMRIIPQKYARHSARSESGIPTDQSSRYFNLIRIHGQKRSLTILLHRLAMQLTLFCSIFTRPRGKKSGVSVGKISMKK